MRKGSQFSEIHSLDQRRKCRILAGLGVAIRPPDLLHSPLRVFKTQPPDSYSTRPLRVDTERPGLECLIVVQLQLSNKLWYICRVLECNRLRPYLSLSCEITTLVFNLDRSRVWCRLGLMCSLMNTLGGPVTYIWRGAYAYIRDEIKSNKCLTA